jgi:hypothetical protein
MSIAPVVEDQTEGVLRWTVVVVSCALLVAACADGLDGASSSSFPRHIDDDDVGDPAAWVQVGDEGPDPVGYIRADWSADPPAPVYDRGGDLVGTFGCPVGAGGGGFTPIGEAPACTSVTSSAG